MIADSTSSDLLTRVTSQDPDAWLRLVTWIGPFILAWCRRANLQPADCDEVSQQVLTNIWRRLPTFRKDQPGQSFRGWAYVITRNALADFWEKRRRAQAADRLGAKAEGGLKLPEEDAADAHSWKRRALRLLIQDVVVRHTADRGFQAFYRTAVDGVSAVDVARELAMSADVVRQHKCRWVKRLRDRLRDQFGVLLD